MFLMYRVYFKLVPSLTKSQLCQFNSYFLFYCVILIVKKMSIYKKNKNKAKKFRILLQQELFTKQVYVRNNLLMFPLFGRRQYIFIFA